jgi:hypothetical protein
MSTGGSSAGQAFRDQLALSSAPTIPAIPVTPATPEPVSHTATKDTRAASRKLVNGRARYSWSGGSESGKMIDLSTAGACILVENSVAAKRVGTLECDIFHNGKRYAFSVPAVCAYSVLAGSKGVKIGLQFGPHSTAVSRAIAEVLVGW